MVNPDTWPSPICQDERGKVFVMAVTFQSLLTFTCSECRRVIKKSCQRNRVRERPVKKSCPPVVNPDTWPSPICQDERGKVFVMAVTFQSLLTFTCSECRRVIKKSCPRATCCGQSRHLAFTYLPRRERESICDGCHFPEPTHLHLF